MLFEPQHPSKMRNRNPDWQINSPNQHFGLHNTFHFLKNGYKYIGFQNENCVKIKTFGGIEFRTLLDAYNPDGANSVTDLLVGSFAFEDRSDANDDENTHTNIITIYSSG
ncbi:hypothetical protein [Acidaminobacter sp.]|uniref:hypothetical protein n=1 Tax=Acidaminobacter sp. TaxID=1872102 RepID=UPI00256D28AA|nr:hypothetical protein [Acidaminobacter sp.]MDK9712395.1 hypothetical protein [Acidaminobacter sp.]